MYQKLLFVDLIYLFPLKKYRPHPLRLDLPLPGELAAAADELCSYDTPANSALPQRTWESSDVACPSCAAAAATGPVPGNESGRSEE